MLNPKIILVLINQVNFLKYAAYLYLTSMVAIWFKIPFCIMCSSESERITYNI